MLVYAEVSAELNENFAGYVVHVLNEDDDLLERHYFRTKDDAETFAENIVKEYA